MHEPAAWKRRYLAPKIDRVVWARDRPERLAVISNEGGSLQAWAWDLASGKRRRVSAEGVGAEEVHILADGTGVVWWLDPTGNERGRWLVSPFEGGEPRALVPGVPDGWATGLSIEGDAIAVGLATDDDYRVFAAVLDAPVREVYRHERPAGVGREYPAGTGGLSADGTLLCLRHAEHGDIERTALRVLDAASDEIVGELEDEGRPLVPSGWSPVSGDPRLIVSQERAGIE